jgi:hypothetical protein
VQVLCQVGLHKGICVRARAFSLLETTLHWPWNTPMLIEREGCVVAFGYLLHNGDDTLYVESYTSLPKRTSDVDGVTHDLDAFLFDPRNFTDQKEQLVLWWVIRQVLRFEPGQKRQVAYGQFSVKCITDHTGYHHATVWKRLGALQSRRILTYRAGKGTTTRGEVILNLRLDKWLPPVPKVRKPRGRHAVPQSVVPLAAVA